MHQLRIDATGVHLDGLHVEDVDQVVIHISRGRSFAHLTVPVELDFNAGVDTVRVVRDDIAARP